jgi:dipeptidyl aminopeptidase/acylaminoacyl peptidase
MLLDKLKTAALLGALSLGLATCAALAAPAPVADPPAPRRPALPGSVAAGQPAPPKPVARPLPKGPNRILFSRDGHLTLADPGGKDDRKVSADREKFQPGPARLSPDGKLLVAMIHAPNPAGPAARPLPKLYVRGPDEPEPGTDLGVECQDFFWSPHGDQIACSEIADAPEKEGGVKTAHFLVDVKTGRKTDLKLPAAHLMTDWSRDGRFFLTTSVTLDKDGPVARLHLLDRDGTERKALTDGKPGAMFGRLSPDNARVLFFRVELPPKDKPGPPRRSLCVLEVTTGKVTEVEGVPPDAEVDSFCWSPDGKRIAYTRRQVRGEGDEPPKQPECALVVCDPDGKNRKTIAAEKGAGPRSVAIANVDWR